MRINNGQGVVHWHWLNGGLDGRRNMQLQHLLSSSHWAGSGMALWHVVVQRHSVVFVHILLTGFAPLRWKVIHGVGIKRWVKRISANVVSLPTASFGDHFRVIQLDAYYEVSREEFYGENQDVKFKLIT